MIKLTTPFSAETVEKLQAGDQVLLSGVIYTGRDAAHKRLCELLDAGKELPVELKDQIIYFVGPSPAKPGKPIGSAGPTTSYRMDAYSPQIIAQTGLRGMIGKGGRNDEVIEAMHEYGCVYFAATGGAAALISKSITSCEVVCYEDLGPEAIHRLTVKDLSLIVAIDAHENDLYQH
jgi:fumarate hydratase subunit beta